MNLSVKILLSHVINVNKKKGTFENILNLSMETLLTPVINVNINLLRRDTLIINTHIESVHVNATYPCDQCEYQFIRKGHLKTYALDRSMEM